MNILNKKYTLVKSNIGLLSLLLLFVVPITCDKNSTGPQEYDKISSASTAVEKTLIGGSVESLGQPYRHGVEITGDLISFTDGLSTSSNCVTYEYDRNRVLSIRHRYTVPNCCPLAYLADVSVANGVIRIIEYDELTEALFPAFNSYEVDMRIVDLPPGKYSIVLTTRYMTEPIEFGIDLNKEPCGSYCY